LRRDGSNHPSQPQLSDRFNTYHSALQIETSGEVCKLAPAERV